MKEAGTKSNKLAQEALENALGLISYLLDKIDHLDVDLKSDRFNKELVEIIDHISVITQLILKIKAGHIVRPEVVKAGKETLEKLEVHLLSITRSLLKSQENKDVVMLSDLLKYELSENLKCWKIYGVPILMNAA